MIAKTRETFVPAGSVVTPNDHSNDNHNADGTSGETVRQKEIGGCEGPDPTRFGDWEKNGRCIDF
jgi:hypothetical protein